MMNTLGRMIFTRGFVLGGNLSVPEWTLVLDDVAKALGMSPVDEPKVWTYPVHGKGGTGNTVVLPITESFLALDTWPDHKGAYLFICSCKQVSQLAIIPVFEKYGLEIHDGFHRDMQIPRG